MGRILCSRGGGTKYTDKAKVKVKGKGGARGMCELEEKPRVASCAKVNEPNIGILYVITRVIHERYILRYFNNYDPRDVFLF